MDIKPQLLDTLKSLGMLPVQKMDKVIQMQDEYFKYQDYKL